MRTQSKRAQVPLQSLLLLATIVVASLTHVLPTLAQEKSYWQGTLDSAGTPLRLDFEIFKDGDRYFGKVYSVDQANAEIPLTKIEFSGKKFLFEADSVDMSYSGTLNDDETVGQGKWTQRGNEIELEIRKVDSIDQPEHIESWKGTLSIQGIKLDIGIQVYRDKDGAVSAKLDSYSQSVTGIPGTLEIKGDEYIATFPSVMARFEGAVNEGRTSLTGKFQQGGANIDLELAASDLNSTPEYVRPQHPKAPFPYSVENVNFENETDQVTLAGTLTIPKTNGPHPVAILISGSGPQDRDETILGHKPFLVIADYLTRQGIAVLRFDDRGSGESTGNFAVATSADFARDVAAGVSFLKSREEIDGEKIGLIGHSEGGLIAPMVAADHSDIAFIVSLAGPGVDGGVILESQTRAMLEAAGTNAAAVSTNSLIYKKVLDYIRSSDGITAEKINDVCKQEIESLAEGPIRAMMEASHRGTGQLLSSPWMVFFIKHDPAPTLARVKCPLLAMNGEKDLQVLADLNLDAIEATLTRADHNAFEIRRMPNMNHLFQETDGLGLPTEYGQLEQTFSPIALQVMGDWILKVTR